MNLHFILKLVT